MSNNRQIRLPLYDISVGTLLTETARASSHSMNPSAFIGRIIEGVRKYREEVAATESKEDRQLMAEVEHRLFILHDDLRHMEDRLYPQPECPPYPVVLD